ncbi:hypothetical protein PTM93_02945 [Clostridium perfringens]|nr:hypothetical protein [Clostridium perfringens]MDK0408274.1 hypothetical protein [Clostridium perfringens]MDK0442533.1 hypothetical protein [Clostridium perfringens]MDK0496275.1 hypothetical protein [Clostridium perfringens]MDK0499183.1 hypothetical protein [Clostridium perfringens]
MGLENLINYCNNMYSNADTKHRCRDCNNDCKGSCESCLELIHFGNNRRYNCKNIINYYVCKYSYKYLSEIGNIFYRQNFINEREKLNIISIGCGPCTDLMGIKQYIENNDLTITLKYLGIDLNENWKDIHKFIKSDFKEEDIDFIYDDVFNVFNKEDNIGNYDILFLQYLISDMIKYNDNDSMNTFIDNLVEKIISHMPVGSLIIINDINLQDVRIYFELILKKMSEKNFEYKYERLHFDNYARPTHYHYGSEYCDNDLICNIPVEIQEKYNPWMFCSSSQLIIKRR